MPRSREQQAATIRDRAVVVAESVDGYNHEAAVNRARTAYYLAAAAALIDPQPPQWPTLPDVPDPGDRR